MPANFTNPEKRKAYFWEYYQKNKEKVKIQQLNYYNSNKEKISLRKRKYYQENKEKYKGRYSELKNKGLKPKSPETQSRIFIIWYEKNREYHNIKRMVKAKLKLYLIIATTLPRAQ